MKTLYSLLLSILVFLFFFTFSYLIFDKYSYKFEKGSVEVFIPPGVTYTEALVILKENGIVTNPFFYKLAARLTGTDTSLKAGYYSFDKRASMYDVFHTLKKGDVLMTSITVIEGETFKDICKKIAANDSEAVECLNLCKDEKFISSLNLNVPDLEGYLYPETYIFVKGVSLDTVLKTMVKELKKNLTQELTARTLPSGLKERELLTLASIIEKEAAVDEDRELIAAVFHNRLKIGMPLQSDPTAVYGMNKDTSKVTNEDILRYSEYNTYHIKGLPPGPIASPGIKSIRAALYPAHVDYLYFVAKKDGTHYFSRTYKEHLRAINQYLK